MSAEFVRKLVEEGIPFVERCGIKLLDSEPGKTRLEIPLEPNLNHIGTMYAGAQFTLGELPGGVLCMTSFDMTRYFPIVKEMTIQFLKPATTALTCEVSLSAEEIERIGAEAKANGKSEFTLSAELKNTEGEVVSVTTGHYQLRQRK
ncbi:YiiD C-terminal domain-containing protein [Endozoicomonadaceae bacterium StTr2]